MAWTVSFDPRALKELEKLDRSTQRRIISFLQERVAAGNNPRATGKALKGARIGLWRYRVGDYRVVCNISDKSASVLVLRVAHRKEVYR